MKRYEYSEDTMEDCITLTDNEEELKTSFDSEIILSPAEDAITLVDKLNYYENFLQALIKEVKGHLAYYDWSEEDFQKTIIEEVEANMDE